MTGFGCQVSNLLHAAIIKKSSHKSEQTQVQQPEILPLEMHPVNIPLIFWGCKHKCKYLHSFKTRKII